MNEAETVWREQYEQIHARLAPWVYHDADGSTYVTPLAPLALREVYREMQSLGYAKGWLP